MAKKTTSKAATPRKAAPRKKATAPTASKAIDIVGVCTAALEKLRELNLDYQLQGEIEWCLGSYASDGNPSGLYVMAERALHEFKNITTTQPKAVPPKLMKDLEQAAKSNGRQ